MASKKLPLSDTSGANGKTVDATPTKDLFIKMLTRDIALIPSIIDLVDNCCDGARRIRGDRDYNDLWARLDISQQQFRLSDNCGGISVDTARKYAFRFGRAKGAPLIKHSVGEFGVGMKRAIFKLGNYFRVESTTSTSRFVIEHNITEWAKTPVWEYRFKELQENQKFPSDQRGTTITVEDLHTDVSNSFALDHFQPSLIKELRVKLQDPISKGLSVTLNGIPVDADHLTLLQSTRLLPAYKQLRIPESGPKPVRVRMYCGLAVSGDRRADRAAAGWHIFCNGRLVLEGDKTSVTGWGEEVDEISVPGFHGQYNSLRGYAFFDCDDPGRLPWNTTKTGINTDSAVYRGAKLEMMKLMLPVKNFLDQLKKEKEQKAKEGRTGEEEKGPYEQVVTNAKQASLPTIRTKPVFTVNLARPSAPSRGPIMQRIQYDKPLSEVQEVRTKLKATSWKQVGEKTFEYFYNAEVAE